MADYAQAKDVYKELREALAPWTKANGFPDGGRGTAAGWQRPQGAPSCFASCSRARRGATRRPGTR